MKIITISDINIHVQNKIFTQQFLFTPLQRSNIHPYDVNFF